MIRIIEKMENRKVLKEIYGWLSEKNLLKYLSDEQYWKLIDALQPEEMTPEDEEAIEKAMKEGFDGAVTQEELKKTS